MGYYQNYYFSEKVQFTLTFYLKQNKEVQLDLCFEIFIFLWLLPSLPPGKMLEEKLAYGFCDLEYAWWGLNRKNM